jgi:hypothetical protein
MRRAEGPVAPAPEGHTNAEAVRAAKAAGLGIALGLLLLLLARRAAR